MSSRPHIDEAFIGQLFAHPAFMQRLQQAQTPQKHRDNPQASVLAEQICSMLSAEYQQRVDEECLSLYRAHAQLAKQVEQMRNAMFLGSPTKAMGSPSKDTPSILSEVELDQGRKMGAQYRGNKGNASFLSSFLCESEIRDKSELQQRINASIVNLSGDVAKFQSAVEERLRNVENSLNRKMESIYKTLTSVFETINDLQSRLNSRQKQEGAHVKNNANGQKQKQKDPRREIVEKVIDLSGSQTRPLPSKQPSVPIQGDTGGRRRSFLGFLKY